MMARVCSSDSSGSGFSTAAFYRSRMLRLLPLWVSAHLVFLAIGLVVGGLSPLDWRYWASLAGLRFLPHSFDYSPLLKPPPESAEASAIVWFDAYVTNVDRSPRNINMLSHRRQLWLIDHGACLYFHHDWRDYLERSHTPFAAIRTHALLRFARGLAEADATLKPRLTPDVIDGIVSLIPDIWLRDGVPFDTPDETRQAYSQWLLSRLDASQLFVEEAQNARPKFV